MDLSCKAQYTGLDQFVRCLEHKGAQCSFAVSVGSTFFCKSPHWSHLYSKKNITIQEKNNVKEKVDPIRVIS